jgi:high affinity Mn2+ porin
MLNLKLLRALIAPMLFASACAAACAQAVSPSPSPSPKPQQWSIHVQTTDTQQYHGYFPAQYSGAQSLSPVPDTAKTFDFTVFFGGRLWRGGEFYVDQEIDQGFGLGNLGKNGEYNGTFGAAGYLTGEAFKLGEHKPYSRTQRYFIRQTFNIGGDMQTLDPDQNQLGEPIASDHLILQVGKFGVTDVFDTNAYAHDPKGDFLNWSVIDMGAFDYAADAWGFTEGISAQMDRGANSFRLGLFQLSAQPNVPEIEPRLFYQFSPVAEAEQRTSFFGGHPGSYKILVYGDYGFMAPLAESVAGAAGTGLPPTLEPYRTLRHWKIGEGINIQQEIANHVGFFARASAMNGTWEAFDYTDIDRSLLAGFSFDGGMWHRPNDAIGIAGVENALSQPAQAYFAAGGLGITIGDGALSYAGEQIVESYYKLGLGPNFAVTGDYQRVIHPAYNLARGPYSVFALRFHAQL